MPNPDGTDTTATPPGTWHDRGDTVIYDSDWVRLVTTDVVMPDGTQVDHHVVRMPRPASGTIIVDEGRILLLWRHRFITDTWGWEIPAGGIDPGETAEQAAIREATEESGWRPASIEHLCSYFPANGLLDQEFHIFVSDGAVDVGEPTDINEAARIEWHDVGEVRRLLTTGEITDGLSFAALCYAFTTDTFASKPPA